MARGWESKSIESQQDDAGRRSGTGRELTAEERQRLASRTNLELALAGTQAELQAACRPAHRDMLRLRLEAIRAQLADLETPTDPPSY
jgi:hypothetical protein